jgi:hypothetical protein
MAKLQALRNRLDTFLFLNVGEIVYFPAYGQHQFIQSPPICCIFVSDKLQPAYEIPEDPDLKKRKARLNMLIEKVKKRGGYVFGDLSKGGRRPTSEELNQLTGFQENRVPVGLVRCPNCGFYSGTCLDPGEMHRGLLMKVYCLCENDNLCARCGQPLCKFKLNANYFKEEDKGIWHVPGFSALSHKCPDMQDKKEPDRGQVIDTESSHTPDSKIKN